MDHGVANRQVSYDGKGIVIINFSDSSWLADARPACGERLLRQDFPQLSRDESASLILRKLLRWNSWESDLVQKGARRVLTVPSSWAEN